MSCPITSSPEWKEFEKKAGSEFNAHALFYANNYEIPDTIDLSKVDTVEVPFVKSLTVYNKKRTDILFELNNTIQEFKQSEKGDLVDKLTAIVGALEAATIEESAEVIINNGLGFVNGLINKLSINEITPEILRTTKSYLGSFENIDVIRDFVEELNIENKTEVLAKLDTLNRKINKFNKSYKDAAFEYSVEELAKRSSVIRAKEKFKLEREFDKNTSAKGYLGGEEKRRQLKELFVKIELEKKEEDITRDTKAFIREQLTRVPEDMGSIATWIDDPRGVKDSVIQIIAQMLDEADFKTDKEFTSARGELLSALEEYEKHIGGTRDTLKKYKGIIEVQDGEETGYYVGVVYNSILNEWKKLVSRQKDLLIPTSIKEKELSEFKEKYILPKYKDKDILSYTEDNHPLALYGKKEIKNPQWNEIYDTSNKKFHTTPKAIMWQALRKFNKESDRLTPGSKLGFRLPGMEAEGSQIMYNDGIVSRAKHAIKDVYSLNNNDVDLGETESIGGVITLSNKRNKVNLPYRNKVDVKKQSFDLVGLALSNRYVSLNYRNKSDIKHTVELVKDVIHDREVTDTRGDNKLVRMTKNAAEALLGVDKEETAELLLDKGQSNAYKLLNSIIQDRVYGVNTVPVGKILGIDGNKLTKSLLRWGGDVMLIGNIASASSNLLQGKIMNFLMSISDGQLKKSDLIQGEKDYWADVASWTGDLGSRVIKSKTNLLLERLVGGSHVNKNFANDMISFTKGERLVSMETLHGLNSSAEHYIQSTLMYSILNSIKINGKSITDYYTVVNGVLVLSPDVNIDESDLRRKIKAVVANAHGNYDANNLAMAQRYWYGKLAFYLRKWIVRGVKRRWSGVNTTDNSLDYYLKNDINKINYSEELGEFTEGTYTSAVRFVRNSYKAIMTLKLQVISQDWSNLSDMEKRNIQSAITEVSIALAALLASTLLAGLAGDDDDEDNSITYAAAYMLRRVYGEIGFYNPLNVRESIRVLSTPTASISMIETISKFSSQMLEDIFNLKIEEKKDGTIKSWDYLNKGFNPFYKNIHSLNFKRKLEYLKTQ